MERLSSKVKEIIADAAKRLTGFKRREYQAKISLEYFDGNTRKTEREMGWAEKVSGKGQVKPIAVLGVLIIIRDVEGRGQKTYCQVLKKQ